MRRALSFTYGLVVYTLFFGTFLYMAAFLGGVPLAPKTIDTDPQPLSLLAVLINVGLLSVFALQHAIMARPAFKARWTKIISPVIERSTFVLATCLVLGTLFWQWRAIDGVVWSFDGALGGVFQGLYWLGIGIVFIATWNIGHFMLFGLRQVWDDLRGRQPIEPVFHTPGLYRHVRHPIMTGFLIALWCVPTMTVGHLLFSSVASAYIFLAVHFLEERDLRAQFGQRYKDYMKRVGSYLPLPRSEGTQDG
jgi:protein-S-isoprenylcysteine O-methyltransferase Ste14